MLRIASTLVLIVAVVAGNALVVRPATVAWHSLADPSGADHPASIQWFGAQHPLLAAKESLPRDLCGLRGEQHWHVVAMPRHTLRPFRLALDWPVLAGRLASASLCWLEVRLQI